MSCNKNKVDKILFTLGILMMFGGIFILPVVQNFAISFGENVLVHRKLDADYWHDFLFKVGISFLCVGILCVANNFWLKKIERRRASLSRFAVPALCAVASLILLIFPFISRDYWFDEAFSLAMTNRHSVFDMLRVAALDTLPPLYYLFLKISQTLFPYSVLAAKTTSAIPSVILIFSVAFFLQKRFGVRAAVYFVLLFMASWPLVYYSFEIRTYSLATLFIALCTIFSYQMIFDGRLRFYIFYGVFAASAAYCHYFAAVAMIFHILLTFAYIIVSDKKNRVQNLKKIAATCVVGIVLYAPQIKTVFYQFGEVSETFWIPPITFETIVEYIRHIFFYGPWRINMRVVKIVPAYCFCAFAFFAAVKTALTCIKASHNIALQETRQVHGDDSFCMAVKNNSAFLLVNFLVPILVVIFGIALSLLVRPLFYIKYIFPCVSLMTLFIAVLLANYIPKKYCLFIFAALGFCAVFNVVSITKNEVRISKNWETFWTKFPQKITEETQFVYLQQRWDCHVCGIFSLEFPNNAHYIPVETDPNFHLEYEKFNECFMSDWRLFDSLEELDFTKPKCFVMTKEYFENYYLPSDFDEIYDAPMGGYEYYVYAFKRSGE